MKLDSIILVFLSSALCLSCNFTRTKEHETLDSVITIQTVEHKHPIRNPINAENFLNKYSREQVLDKLYQRSDSITKWTNYDMREWKYTDSSIIVLNQIELDRKNYRSAFEICLLKEIEGKLELIAKGIIENDADNEGDYYLANTRFDTSTYRISEQEYAIGITGTPTWVYNGPNYYNLGTNLILFRIVKNKISPIVLLQVEYTHGDRHQENDSTILY